jgi:hypothetical protein
LDEQRAHRKRYLGVIRRVSAAAFVGGIGSRIELAFSQQRRVVLPKVGLLERLFDIERCDRQGANHLEREEADDVGGIVVGLEVELRRQIEKLPESFGWRRAGLVSVALQ